MDEDARRLRANLLQGYRMFGHHRNKGVTPCEPENQIGAGRTDEELDAELAELKAETDTEDY